MAESGQSNFEQSEKGQLNFEPSGLLNFQESSLSDFSEKPIKSTNVKLHSLTAYSLYINPLAFFDVNFMLIGAGVVLVAVLEKKLADNGIIGVAAILSGVLHIALPVVAFGLVIFLVSQLGVFL